MVDKIVVAKDHGAAQVARDITEKLVDAKYDTRIDEAFVEKYLDTLSKVVEALNGHRNSKAPQASVGR